MIAVLAGGTGGAKLARGLLDVVPPSELTVIANTADDAEVYGVHVSPDPDLVTYWLADVIDEERGYGLRGDTWRVMEALVATGRDAWFQLGDRDLANCMARTALLRSGAPLGVAAAELARALGVVARVLPMTDHPVRTHVLGRGRWMTLQEFLIAERAAVPIEAVEVRGTGAAHAGPGVLDALAAADAIVIGPSNPVISIGPILAVPGVRDAIATARAPVVAVSPFVGGRAVKGPTEAFCLHAGLPLGAGGVVRAYAGLLDGVVADEPPPGEFVAGPRGEPAATEPARGEPITAKQPPEGRVPEAPHDSPPPRFLEMSTLMDTAARRRELAAATLQFAATLRG